MSATPNADRCVRILISCQSNSTKRWAAAACFANGFRWRRKTREGEEKRRFWKFNPTQQVHKHLLPNAFRSLFICASYWQVKKLSKPIKKKSPTKSAGLVRLSAVLSDVSSFHFVNRHSLCVRCFLPTLMCGVRFKSRDACQSNINSSSERELVKDAGEMHEFSQFLFQRSN